MCIHSYFQKSALLVTGLVFTISNAYCMYTLVTTCNRHALKLQHSLEKDQSNTSFTKEQEAFLQTLLLPQTVLSEKDDPDSTILLPQTVVSEKDDPDDPDDETDEPTITKMHHKTTQTSSEITIRVQDDVDSQYLPSSATIILPSEEPPPPSRLATFFG
jgi:cytoskeletal protein RodZ